MLLPLLHHCWRGRVQCAELPTRPGRRSADSACNWSVQTVSLINMTTWWVTKVLRHTHPLSTQTFRCVRECVCVCVRACPHFKSACRGFASGVWTQVFWGHFAQHFSDFLLFFFFNFYVRILSYSVFLTTYVSSPFLSFGLQLFSQFQLSFNVLNVIIIRFLKASWDNASRTVIHTHIYICICVY